MNVIDRNEVIIRKVQSCEVADELRRTKPIVLNVVSN